MSKGRDIVAWATRVSKKKNMVYEETFDEREFWAYSMRMLAERLPSSEVDQSTPSQKGSLILRKIAQICTLMVAQILQAHEAHAEPPQQERGMHATIARHIEKLDDADFTMRHDAQQAIIECVHTSLERQNPLPIDIYQVFNHEQRK